MRVGVLGGGQLGRMLALEGIPLGHRFTFLEPSPGPPVAGLGTLVAAPYDDPEGLAKIAAASDVVTYEFENVPCESAAYLAARLPALPPPAALQVAQDRLAEKQMFRELGIPTPVFHQIDGIDCIEAALAETGLPAVIKTRRLGYDGKGQVVARTAEEAAAAVQRLGGVADDSGLIADGSGLIAESFVPFERELSVLSVRGRDGSRVFYPLTENHHRGGILRVSYAPAPGLTSALQAEGEALATRVMERLEYIGVLAVELFQVDGRLIASEIAPRVHNSGHWTIDGAGTSQFENHIRAVTGLPLSCVRIPGPAAMINLIGELPDLNEVAAVPGAHIHLYDKASRPERKLGHVNVVGDDKAAVERTVERVWGVLPAAGELPCPTGRQQRSGRILNPCPSRSTMRPTAGSVTPPQGAEQREEYLSG